MNRQRRKTFPKRPVSADTESKSDSFGRLSRRTRYHHDPVQQIEAARALLDRPELAKGCVLVLNWARRVVDLHESRCEPKAGQLSLELEVAQ
jgi:hypothetical protein